jgi:hypothetical protein
MRWKKNTLVHIQTEQRGACYVPTLCNRSVNPGNACMTLAAAENLGPVCKTCRKRYLALPEAPTVKGAR